MTAYVIYAQPIWIEDDELDGYDRRGVVLGRMSAHLTIAALRRDAAEMRTRGGDANLAGAEENDSLALAIGQALTTRPAARAAEGS
jgi:hypothetical protein